MVRGSVTVPVLADRRGCRFADVAVADIMTGPKTGTDGRISPLTRIRRRFIGRFKATQQAAYPPLRALTIASQSIPRRFGSAAAAAAGAVLSQTNPADGAGG